MRIAALDLGSNTFLCLIAEVVMAPSGRPLFEEILSDEVRMVRLGQDVSKTKRFHPEALVRAEIAFKDFRKQLDQFKPDVILAMATSAARDVSNQDELFALGRKYEIPIEIIPGAKEAEITYAGAVSAQLSEKSMIVVDIGGGSTELIRGHGPQLRWAQSLDLGCVRLKEKIDLQTTLTSEKLQRARQIITAELATLKHQIDGTESILAVSGTPTELARIQIGHFDPQLIEGFQFSIEGLEEWVRVLSPMNAVEVESRYGVAPGRSDVLVLGALILAEVTAFFKQANLTVSTRGVRYGVALTAFERSRAIKGMG